ncbi:hypothetical protein O3G_MSEX002440 [Manduca sexta]|uniref:Nuclear cap-binding protein subunit 3 n=1 Tax=Manduca sexta TaxID=7130 RepID=A0A921YNK9_MANSE|nr:hypothetical protein O3G_MSEX002440 [Manduca sexta]
MDREDGEMSDDNTMVVDEDVKDTVLETEPSTLLYKTEKNGLVIKKLEKVDAIKLEERARRFGLNLTGNRVITQKQIDDLYENFGIEIGNERHFRFDSIHLSGIDGLTTKEIFQYLEDYKPLSLEWIDNTSCNVVCQDHISAALALLAHSREINDQHLKETLVEKSNYHWREGVPHPRKDLIFMRFATNGDKKIVKKKNENKSYVEYYDREFDSASKNPWGDLCKSWGVYDHQEVFGTKYVKHDYEDEIEQPEKIIPIKNKRIAMRLGKRPHSVNYNYTDDDSNSDSEWISKSKTPRMRMHADDEEKKQKQKYVSNLPKEEYTDKFAPLSIEVINNQSHYSHRETTKLSDKFKYHNKPEKSQNIQSRLGERILPDEDASSSDDSSPKNLYYSNIMSKVQKVRSKNNEDNSIWSRLEDAPSSTAGAGSDLRQIIKSRKQKKPDDLRERLSKSKQSNLRIEIDNN